MSEGAAWWLGFLAPLLVVALGVLWLRSRARR